MWINGMKVDSTSGKSLEVLNPATEQVLDEVPRGTVEDTHQAIAAASEAFLEWRRTPGSERAAALHQVAAKVRAHHDELVELLTKSESNRLFPPDSG